MFHLIRLRKSLKLNEPFPYHIYMSYPKIFGDYTCLFSKILKGILSKTLIGYIMDKISKFI